MQTNLRNDITFLHSGTITTSYVEISIITPKYWVMSLLDKVAQRLFKERLIKLEQDIIKSQGSDFYARVLEYVGKNPILMADNVEAYVNEGYLFNPTVYAIVSFIAQKASSIPFSVYEVKNDKMLNLYKNASPDLPMYKKEMVKKKALVQLPDHELN